MSPLPSIPYVMCLHVTLYLILSISISFFYPVSFLCHLHCHCFADMRHLLSAYKLRGVATKSRCWDMLESTPARIPLIKSSHKWTQILFIISNSKLGICIYSQTRIDLNSQSNLYDALKIDHTRLCSTQSTKRHTQNTSNKIIQ